MTKRQLHGFIGLVGSAFVGGAILPSVIRLGTELMHPFLFNFARIFIGLFIALFIFRGQYQLKSVFKRQYFPAALILSLGLGLNLTLFSFAIAHTTLIASQLIYICVPIVTSLIAYLLIGEKITSRKILGMVLAFIGVFLLIFFSRSPEEASSLGTFYGNFLIFIAMFGYSIHLVFSKKISASLSVIEVVILTSSFLSLITFPLALYAIYQDGLSQINLHSLAVMLLVAVSAILFMSLSQLAIKKLSANTASLGSLLSPEFAALAGIVLYGEKISMILFISMALSFSGIIIGVQAEKTTFLEKMKRYSKKLLRT